MCDADKEHFNKRVAKLYSEAFGWGLCDSFGKVDIREKEKFIKLLKRAYYCFTCPEPITDEDLVAYAEKELSTIQDCHMLLFNLYEPVEEEK